MESKIGLILGQPGAADASRLVIKRTRGLGNMICLLPVLEAARRRGSRVTVVTRPEWRRAFAQLLPRFEWVCETERPAADLDRMTLQVRPQEHRTAEFGRLLGIAGPYPPVRVEIPDKWRYPFEHLAGCVLFAPESGHPSRSWPLDHCQQLCHALTDTPMVLVGLRTEPPLEADVDLRGDLETPELFGLIAVAGAVVTMDSAVLHIAGLLGIPTVAVFGGVDPRFRVAEDQRAIVLQADMSCCPCNKNETCQDRFPCVAYATCADVLTALADVRDVEHRVIKRLSVPTPAAAR